VNKLVSLTWLLWALRSFQSFTLHYSLGDAVSSDVHPSEPMKHSSPVSENI